ncbi:hypothetical protein [Siphonobacter sp. SORGH_AS_0500]|nr:hypothetical protein [Siphonobacter sp. SORGH_AS_0500]MDR6195607.1 hypothetical protein [Siphonobacter sp. SORGH_AS_0500]
MNLVNIEAFVVTTGAYGSTGRLDLEAKSTGVFEKYIADTISK